VLIDEISASEGKQRNHCNELCEARAFLTVRLVHIHDVFSRFAAPCKSRKRPAPSSGSMCPLITLSIIEHARSFMRRQRL
jgi:hypothetical protein